MKSNRVFLITLLCGLPAHSVAPQQGHQAHIEEIFEDKVREAWGFSYPGSGGGSE